MSTQTIHCRAKIAAAGIKGAIVCLSSVNYASVVASRVGSGRVVRV